MCPSCYLVFLTVFSLVCRTPISKFYFGVYLWCTNPCMIPVVPVLSLLYGHFTVRLFRSIHCFSVYGHMSDLGLVYPVTLVSYGHCFVHAYCCNLCTALIIIFSTSSPRLMHFMSRISILAFISVRMWPQTYSSYLFFFFFTVSILLV